MAPRSKTRGFTLVEVMIGAALGSVILAGVLSTFLMLGRMGANIASYTTMDSQTRRALEDFAQDVRMANNITWNSATSITLTVPDNYVSNSNQVTYAWDSTAGSSTYHYFYRKPGDSASGATKSTYIANVTSFTFYRYDRLNAATATDAATKRVQINLTVTTTNSTVVSATDTTLSASFILRNKPSA
jgi:prepilin-type N-terminal cleavage/methylation domain-containing protein